MPINFFAHWSLLIRASCSVSVYPPATSSGPASLSLDRFPLHPLALSHGSPSIFKFLDLIFFKSNLLTSGDFFTHSSTPLGYMAFQLRSTSHGFFNGPFHAWACAPCADARLWSYGSPLAFSALANFWQWFGRHRWCILDYVTTFCACLFMGFPVVSFSCLLMYLCFGFLWLQTHPKPHLLVAPQILGFRAINLLARIFGSIVIVYFHV
jgi:hypothetical protein